MHQERGEREEVTQRNRLACSLVRALPVAALALLLTAVCAWPASAGPFFSARSPGSYSPGSWADVARHVTYGGRPSPVFTVPQPIVPSTGMQPPAGSSPGLRTAPVPQGPGTVPAGGGQPVRPPSDDPSASGAAGVLTPDERLMLDLLNGERVRAGLGPLAVDPVLVRLARLKSEDMVANGYFGHISPNYGSPFAMMDRAGVTYRFAGENLAGAPSVDVAHRALMNSPGHRANILNPNFTHVGIGIARGGPYGFMYTQMFVGR